VLAKARDAAKVRLVNTSTTNQSAARDAGHPLNRLRHHLSDIPDPAAEIASLRAERTAYQTAARAWKDEAASLRAALEPFAELATSAKCDEMPEFAARTFVITAASMLAIAGKGDK
jgi:class 3 adenylate cyclase